MNIAIVSNAGRELSSGGGVAHLTTGFPASGHACDLVSLKRSFPNIDGLLPKLRRAGYDLVHGFTSARIARTTTRYFQEAMERDGREPRK